MNYQLWESTEVRWVNRGANEVESLYNKHREGYQREHDSGGPANCLLDQDSQKSNLREVCNHFRVSITNYYQSTM